MTALRSDDPLSRSTTTEPSGWGLLLASALFVAAYLAADGVSSLLADSPMPQPNADGSTALDWFRRNGAAAAVQAGLQALSVVGLGSFVLLLHRREGSRAALPARAATAAGLLAVLLMITSSVLTWIVAASADTLTVDRFVALRFAGFVTGGTAHVFCLGLFVLLAARAPATPRAIRMFAVVAAVPALVSPVSLIVYQGAVAILAGRLLCMTWCIAMSISSLRRGITDR